MSLFSLYQGTNRTLSLEKRFVNSIVDFWKKEVISELRDITNPNDLHGEQNQILPKDLEDHQ
ncbi:MAG: hypothetical protein OEY49_20340 [Candidatus Heimdallarchaeota archaeon]|nr:hypothetical protein [Candidatus Heimdallarchaeota archaeon]